MSEVSMSEGSNNAASPAESIGGNSSSSSSSSSSSTEDFMMSGFSYEVYIDKWYNKTPDERKLTTYACS
jgi:hypothetical protein